MMLLDLEDDMFRVEAEQWLSGLNAEVILRFDAVVNASPGYYPTTLHALWLAEVARRGLQPERAQSDSDHHEPAVFPVSHPLDADWRFTLTTAESLLDLASMYAQPRDRLVHIGTPTTFRLGTRQQPALHHVLIERSKPIIASLLRTGHDPADLHCIDVQSQTPPTLEAAAAIIDPPWYLNDTVAFLTAAAVSCRKGATLLLCQPTMATRPGVAAERERLEASLPALGLGLADAHIGSVRYLTPHFEAMSLRLANPGLPDLPTWRLGDLMIIRKERAPVALPSQPLHDAPLWADIEFGPVRIKIRQTSEQAAGDLTNVVPGDVLRTVSRRDSARHQAGLWTSGNRVFGLAHPEEIAQLVRLCADDLATQRFTFTRTLNHAHLVGVARSTAHQLFDVLLLELQEHGALGRT